MTAIEARDISKIYKLYAHNRDRVIEGLGLSKHRHTDHLALAGVNITVDAGECVGIIGTNGSGKSTLLKIITGVLSPTAGTVQVNGRISALLELGAGFNMEYTGIQNVYLNGTMMGYTRREIDAKLPGILEFADIGEYAAQPVRTYSSGMFVRLAFAVAINIDPDILIVDEALSVGDVYFQAKCYRKFEEFKQSGKTILFVSHDLSSISKYCDRVMLLNNGRVQGTGTPKAMIDAYKQLLAGSDEPVRTSSSSETLDYGNKAAEITDYYITDESGTRTNTIVKGTVYTIHMTAVFHSRIAQPIFAYTIKNALGIEITGTNTLIEGVGLTPAEPGSTALVTFTQRQTLQGGEYLLSLGLTGYESERFTVYHRLYDAVSITVISDKNTVGYYDAESIAEVTYECD